MKHVGKELFRIIDQKKLVKRRIATNIGMNPSQFNQLMHRRSIDSEKLEQICKELNISPGFFFDDWPSDKYTIGEINNSSFIGDANVNVGEHSKHLEMLLAEKDKLIEEKERLIKLLSFKAGVEI